MMMLLVVLLVGIPSALAVARRTVLRAAGAAAVPLASVAADADGAADCQRRCLVAGSTGRLGRYVVAELRERPEVAVLAGVRSEASRLRLPPGVPALVGLDLSSDDPDFVPWLSAAMRSQGVTDVICTVGFSPTFVPSEDRRLASQVDNEGTRKLIAAADGAGLSGRFVLVSSLGIALSTQSARMLDQSLGGVLAEKALAESALRRSTLDWCIVRPGLLQKEVAQGGVLLGLEDRFVGDAARDREGLGAPVKCASPFLASSGAVCAATRAQVADVCVAALTGERAAFSRRVVEVVARPDVPVTERRGGPFRSAPSLPTRVEN